MVIAIFSQCFTQAFSREPEIPYEYILSIFFNSGIHASFTEFILCDFTLEMRFTAGHCDALVRPILGQTRLKDTERPYLKATE